MKEQDYILIEDYLTGELSADEREQFEKKLASDTEFKDKFETYQQLSQQLKYKYQGKTERQLFQKSLEKESDKYFKQKENQSKKSKLRPWRLGVAAIILILLGIYTYQEMSTPVFTDFNQYSSVSFQSRGQTNEALQNAEEAFNSQQYAEAVSYFEDVLKTDSKHEYRLYLAISLVEIDQFEKADQIYLELIQGDHVFVNEALWFGALSKLKQNDYKATSQLLSQIPEESDRYEQAQKLYHQLN